MRAFLCSTCATFFKKNVLQITINQYFTFVPLSE